MSQIEELIKDFIDSSWKWSHQHNYWENHWGNLLLAKYGKDKTYSDLSLRVDPAYFGILISERGMLPHEVKEFAFFIDKKWDEVYHSENTLPTEMPFIDVDAIENGDQNLEEKTRGLSHQYSSSSFQGKDPNYQWGGMTYSRGNSKFFEKEDQGDEHTKTLSRIANDFFKLQQESDNRLSSDQIPINVLVQVVNYCPELATKWLSVVEPHHDPERAERMTSFCNIFYESLCAALFHLSDSRSVKLYSFLRNKERKITLFDSITRIFFLDSALFKTSRTDLSNKMWINRLEDCRFDLELMEISIAAQQGGKVDWIEEYVVERLQSDIPIYLSYGLTILGFIDTTLARNHLQKQINIQPDSWRKELAKLSYERWLQNSYSKHWFKSFINENDPDLAWSYFRLFLRCVDRRYWLWKKDLIRDASTQPGLKRNLEFLEDNINSIQNRIRSNEKPFAEYFLGQKIEKRQAWPWL